MTSAPSLYSVMVHVLEIDTATPVSVHLALLAWPNLRLWPISGATTSVKGYPLTQTFEPTTEPRPAHPPQSARRGKYTTMWSRIDVGAAWWWAARARLYRAVTSHVPGSVT